MFSAVGSSFVALRALRGSRSILGESPHGQRRCPSYGLSILRVEIASSLRSSQ
jgi:hypothetical protein